jgi:ankyrin repeat protein
MEGHVAVAQFLVERGADKSRITDHGFTPLYVAAENNHVAMVEFLVGQGFDKDHVCEMNGGTTPLLAACHSGHVDMAEYLLDQGCDRDHADDHGWTALHFAAYHGRLDIAHVLFRYGVKLDARNSRDETPADVATARGHHAFADAIRAEEIRRRDHGFKRDPSTIDGTEEHEASKRPRVEEPAAQQDEAVDESDDDDDDDDDEEEA